MEDSRVLAICDELTVAQIITRTLGGVVLAMDVALTPSDAARRFRKTEYDLVFLDVKWATLLDELRSLHPSTPVVVMLGPAPLETVAHIMGSGGLEFLPKPFTGGDLSAALGRALNLRAQLLQAREAAQSGSELEFAELVGTSPAMRGLLRTIRQVGPTGMTVVLLGEVGTGRLLAARALHQASPRRYEPFVTAHLPDTDSLTALQLFGQPGRSPQIKGTPALVERAGAGTLYIEEICHLSLDAQVHLSRALRERRFTPVGGRSFRPLSCRVILATVFDLLHEPHRSKVVPELLTSVPLFPIYLPTLAERTEDIPALIYHFLNRYSRRFGKSVTRVDERLLTRLISRRWPNNVRELASCIERMVRVCKGDTLGMEHYLAVMEGGISYLPGRAPLTAAELSQVKKQIRREAVADVERSFLIRALQRSGGNVTVAAREAGMERRNFQTLMRRHGIKAG